MNATFASMFGKTVEHPPQSSPSHSKYCTLSNLYFLSLVRRQGGAEAAREEELVQQTFSSTGE